MNKPTEKEIADNIAAQSQSGKLIDIKSLIDSDYKQSEYLTLIECPLSECDYRVDNWHRKGSTISDHLLHDHRPEDFGLRPLSDAADQDPEQVVVSDGRYDVFHLQRCCCLSNADPSDLSVVDFDELHSGFRCCRKCKGRPVDLSFMR